MTREGITKMVISEDSRELRESNENIRRKITEIKRNSKHKDVEEEKYLLQETA